MQEINNKVTFVLTSCKRFDLLGPTLSSFLKYNTYPIEEFIIIEDSPAIEKLNQVLKDFPEIKFTTLYNDPQIGQLRSIDRAYSLVKTDYIFHCEDDWLFYRHSFIEKSFSILHENDKIINVWLREQNDTNKHPLEMEVNHTKDGVGYKYLQTGFQDGFHGFTFNPSLRRTKDYELIKPYSNWPDEIDLSNEYYHKYHFRGVILVDGYVRHLGDHRKIRYNINEKEWVKSLKISTKRISAYICKIFGI
ncbi:MAG: glycosyltransferase family A protein [Bacteroidota bacterium]|nr:glycosyltransferase family A protein [Bacteroidota bacterium]